MCSSICRSKGPCPLSRSVASLSSPQRQSRMNNESKAPRVGHKKSRNGCYQCKRRHVKCNEKAPCSNCVRHGVACSLAGGPQVERDDAKHRRPSATPSTASKSQPASVETSGASTSAADSAGTSPVSEARTSYHGFLLLKPNIVRFPIRWLSLPARSITLDPLTIAIGSSICN